MLTRTIWPVIRRIVPVAWYPALGFVHRIDETLAVRRLERADKRYRCNHSLIGVPPPQMRFRVAGECDIPTYISGSDESRVCLATALYEVGKSFENFSHVLDFGCGCGRTLRAFRERPAYWRLFGADIDQRAIDWCRANQDAFDNEQSQVTGDRPADASLKFYISPEMPPLPFANGLFDLVWAISVFTHLDERRQAVWLSELRRVVRPGGMLLATVHGSFFWAGLPNSTIRQIKERGLVYARIDVDRGQLPDWYQCAWHTREYVESTWERYFRVLKYLPCGMHGRQDLVVLQR